MRHKWGIDAFKRFEENEFAECGGALRIRPVRIYMILDVHMHILILVKTTHCHFICDSLVFSLACVNLTPDPFSKVSTQATRLRASRRAIRNVLFSATRGFLS